MTFVDGTGINIALPVIQQELNASVPEVQWIVESYVIVLAALTLLGGSLGDKYGRRRVFAAGVWVFAMASILCGLAPTSSWLIAGRIVQGIGGALLMPGSLSIIGAYFTLAERGKAIGTWSAFSAIMGMLGPVIAGWLIDAANWRWIFFINLPLAAVTLFLLYRYVPESWDESADLNPDWRGSLTAVAGLGLLVFSLVEAPRLGISHPLIISTLVSGVLVTTFFVWLEMRSPSPLVPLHLFRSKTFSGINLATLTMYTALNGTMFFLPFNLIHGQGFTAIQAGLCFIPLSLTIFFMSRWTGGLINRVDPRKPLIAGALIAGLAYGVMAATIEQNFWLSLFPAIILLGIGLGFTIAPLTAVVMSSLESQYSGFASGINNAIARLSAVLAIAVFGLIVLFGFNQALDEGLNRLSVAPETLEHFAGERIKLAAAAPPSGLDNRQINDLKQLIKSSFLQGFRQISLFSVFLCLVTAGLYYWTLPPGQKNQPSDEMT